MAKTGVASVALTMSKLSVIILAAGQGTRMRSGLPKVLHPVGGRPMLAHVIDSAQALAPERVLVVYGHGGEQVREAVAADAVWVQQAKQLGTGHAVQQAVPHLGDTERVLVLYGDVPLISSATLEQLIANAGQDGLGLLAAHLDDPSGYGRIVRNADGDVVRIVEHKDASDLELGIREINTGILTAPRAHLSDWLSRLRSDNAQGEYYLTDVIAMAVADGVAVRTSHPRDNAEIVGINNKAQLAYIERHYQRRQAERLMEQGVTLMDAARLDIRGDVSVGQDVTIDVNVVLEGRVRLGDGVTIGANCVIRDSELGPGTQVLPMSCIEDSVIGPHSRVGPFSRLRPGNTLADHTHIGNFVEIKNSEVGSGSKINHLSYVGDTTVGQRVNIGAGTITCNYDGANKHRTVIGDDAFIGSDTQLVAPVEVGTGATVGAGSTITRDAPPNDLTLSRAKQQTISGWKRPQKKK